MELLITEAFLHVKYLGPLVADGRYFLLGPDRAVIVNHLWEKLIQPGWEISMHIWWSPKPVVLGSTRYAHSTIDPIKCKLYATLDGHQIHFGTIVIDFLDRQGYQVLEEYTRAYVEAGCTKDLGDKTLFFQTGYCTLVENNNGIDFSLTSMENWLEVRRFLLGRSGFR